MFSLFGYERNHYERIKKAEADRVLVKSNRNT